MIEEEVFTSKKLSGASLLDVQDLTVRFRTYEGKVHALDKINFTLKEGEILGLIGESGSGKSTIASSILGLLPNNAEVEGKIEYKGEELIYLREPNMSKKNLKKVSKMVNQRLSLIRWKEISMIFQGAMNAFNPVHTIRNQIHEVFEVHGTFSDLSEFTESDYIDERLLRQDAHERALAEIKNSQDQSLSALEESIFRELLSNLKMQLPTLSQSKKRKLLEKNRVESACLIAGFNRKFLDSYPHELSGGMKQRGIIAMALVLKPKIVIADEPTTGLDVITQAKIIKELKELKLKHVIKSMIVISHDIGVISQLANFVAVMYAGRMMEYGDPVQIFRNQRNPYTYALLKSYPSIEATKSKVYGIPGSVPDLIEPSEGCYFAQRCFMAEKICFSKKPDFRELEPGHFSLCHFDSVSKERYEAFSKEQLKDEVFKLEVKNTEPLIETKGLTKFFTTHSGLATNLFGGANKPIVHAVDNVDVNIRKGEIIGVVGESGSGKTTLGKLLVSAIRPTRGSISFKIPSTLGINSGSISEGSEDMVEITNLPESSIKYLQYRKEAQLIFQDPYDSINPKMSVFDIVSEPLQIQKKLIIQRRTLHSESLEDIASIDIEKEVRNALEIANIRPPDIYLDRYPHELSGGERQRVSIARVITLNPMFIVADEPISMLDVSIRANIMNIFLNLREKYNMAILYISHDIASARYISDYLLIMYLGQVIEYGPTEQILRNPQHPYTKVLISSVPSIDPSWSNKNIEIIGEIGSSINPPKGCRFFDRCVYRKNICREEDPPILIQNEGFYRCHFTEDQLIRNTIETD